MNCQDCGAPLTPPECRCPRCGLYHSTPMTEMTRDHKRWCLLEMPTGRVVGHGDSIDEAQRDAGITRENMGHFLLTKNPEWEPVLDLPDVTDSMPEREAWMEYLVLILWSTQGARVLAAAHGAADDHRCAVERGEALRRRLGISEDEQRRRVEKIERSLRSH